MKKTKEQDLLILLMKMDGMVVHFEWGHDASKFAETMKNTYRLPMCQHGNQVTIINPFGTGKVMINA